MSLVHGGENTSENESQCRYLLPPNPASGLETVPDFSRHTLGQGVLRRPVPDSSLIFVLCGTLAMGRVSYWLSRL